MIGSLLYLTTSKPNITFSIGACTRYIAGTLKLGLWYPSDTHFDVTCYIDVDWARNVDDWKNTYGGFFYIGNCLVTWMSKKQNSVSLSIVEVEYVVTNSCCT